MGYLAQEMEGLTRLDEDLLIAVISLYRKDLAEAKKSGKASGKTDSITGDDLTSIELYLNELESALTFEKDHRLAQSIVQAKLTDFHAIDEIVRAEQQDYEDRQLALRLAGRTGGAIDNNAAANRPPTSYDEVIGQTTPLLSKLAGLWVSEDAGRALHPDNKQGYVDLEPEFDEALATKMDCAVCGDSKSFFELVEVSCKHMYCKGCIQELFNLSYHDESLFPPRCCSKSIKVADVSIFLTKKLIAQFDEKDIEFKTVDKTYCANKECLKFVLPGTLSNGIGHCQKCDTNTCAFCKNEAHVGTDCPSDPSLKAVLDLAEEEGWKRCDRCKSMVELRIGCYHITCRCGYGFCYLCGVAWENCKCPQWDPDRLVERAHQVAFRERRDVAQVKKELITRHNCSHQEWRSCPGGECDECGHDLPIFLYRCQQCRVEFCRRCRLNRTR